MNTTGLFKQLCKSETLWKAWVDVKNKNTAGGIDQVTVEEFSGKAKSEVELMATEISEGKYIPLPYKKTQIPKSDHSFRSLGLLSVRDKIVQQAVNRLLYPIIDKQLSSACYAYRYGKGAIKAVKRVKHAITVEHRRFMVASDIKSYFDNINQGILFDMLRKMIADEAMLDFIKLCVSMGKVKHGVKWEDNSKGVPQGGIVSPLLANLYLTPFDNALLQANFSLVRYADDFVILTQTSEHALKAMSVMGEELRKLQLTLKAAPEIREIHQGFDFLGISFSASNISLSDAKKERMIEKINQAFQSKPQLRTGIVKKTLQGYKTFYAQLLPASQLEHVDACVADNISRLMKASNSSQQKHIIKQFEYIQFFTAKYRKNRSRLFRENTATTTTTGKPLAKPVETTIKAQKPKADDLIKKRKLQYQKLEAEAKELVVNRFGSFVGIAARKITVKNRGQKPIQVPIQNLGHISILSKGVSLSTDLLYECAQQQIAVSFFSNTGELYATLHSPFVTDNKLWVQQMQASDNHKACFIAQTIIEAKIRNQVNLLKYFNKYHKTADEGFAELFKKKIDNLSVLAKKAKSVKYSLPGEYRKECIAIEAQAAALYWQMVAELIDDESDFKGRERKGAKDLVNSMLNYGYAILYARITQAIMKARLNPAISFLHVPQTHKPSLAFDIIELFRQQAVDRVVISLIQKKEKMEIVKGLLSNESKSKLTQNIYERLHRYETYRGEKRRFSDIISIQTSALAQYISGEADTYKPYIAKW